MTRQEFFEQRARLHFARTHGVTKCPPAARGEPALTHGRSYVQHRLTMTGVAHRMVAPLVHGSSASGKPIAHSRYRDAQT
jgi:hypothetical protein